MRIPYRSLILLAAFACAGCVTAGGEAPARVMSADELHRTCAGQMYTDRVSRGRSAPNWHLYEHCMKRHG